MRACNLPVYTGKQPRMAEASPSPSGKAAMHLLKDSAHQEQGPATLTPLPLFQLFKHWIFFSSALFCVFFYFLSFKLGLGAAAAAWTAVAAATT